MLNKDVYKILTEVYKYSGQIRKSVDFVTNGTLEIPLELLELFEKNKNKTKVVISNYGENLSKKADIIQHELEKREIPFRVSKFYGDNLYYDGWIDFSDHSLKWDTKERKAGPDGQTKIGRAVFGRVFWTFGGHHRKNGKP